METISKKEFDRLSQMIDFVELEFNLSNTKSNDVKFYGSELGRDVLLIAVYNCDICTSVQLIKETHICKFEDKYILRSNIYKDIDNDPIFYREDVIDFPNTENIKVTPVSTDEDNILNDQLASIDNDDPKPNNTFSISNLIGEKGVKDFKEGVQSMVETAKKVIAEEKPKIEKSAESFAKPAKETQESLVVNKPTLEKIEPEFKKAQEKIFEAQEKEAVTSVPKPIVTTGRKINNPKPQNNNKPKQQPQKERKVVRAVDYSEPEETSGGYWS